jgi:hypothetical protein
LENEISSQRSLPVFVDRIEITVRGPMVYLNLYSPKASSGAIKPQLAFSAALSRETMSDLADSIRKTLDSTGAVPNLPLRR